MKSKKIVIVCPYPYDTAPSQRLKYEQYFPYFQQQGYEIDIKEFVSPPLWKIIYTKGNFFKKIYWTIFGYVKRLLLLPRLRKYDIVYIHLWVTPLGFPFFEWLYCRFSKKIIYDIDDLIFQQKASENNSFIQKIKGNGKSLFLIKNADYVITTTPYLVEICKKYNTNVVGIPPTLDENSIFPIQKNNTTNKQLVIGWSGSYTTTGYLKIIEQPIQKILQNYQVELLIFGTDKVDDFIVPHQCVAWSAAIENEVFNQFDIALYPLDNTEWSQGKYGGKLIQYLAAGLPVVVSNANAIIPTVITNNENGFIVENTVDDWYEKLKMLIENKDTRLHIGINARKTFENNFSILANKEKYLQVLEKTLEISNKK